MVGMSRYIWCLSCFASSGYEQERCTAKLGLLGRFGVSCDQCNRSLEIATKAAAVSFYEQDEDYEPWEHEYLATLESSDHPKNERPSCGPTHGEADDRSREPAPAKVTSCDNAWQSISTYTRRQAMHDGMLVDVTSLAFEVGFRCSVAVTLAVWEAYIAVPPGIEGQDETGRLWDVLTMLSYAIRTDGHSNVSHVRYRLHVRNDNREDDPPLVELLAACGPDDDGSPCITIMLPDED